MEQTQISEIKKHYYSNEDYLYNIISYIYPFSDIYREVAFLNKPKGKDYKKIAFRAITFTTPKYLYKTMSFQNFFNNDGNIYCSVALVKQLPLFPFNHTDRCLKTKPFFENEFKDYIIRKDIFIDTDLEEKNLNEDTFEIRLLTYKRFIEFLYTNNINFETAFSGSRGFKTLIYNYDNIIKDTSLFLHKLACFFYGIKYTQKNVLEITKRKDNIFDLVGCNIPSKLMKCTYSICITENIIRFVSPIYKDNFDFVINNMKESKYKIFEITNSIFKNNMYRSYYSFEFYKENNIIALKDFINRIEIGYINE